MKLSVAYDVLPCFFSLFFFVLARALRQKPDLPEHSFSSLADPKIARAR
jgi:hypothetical protein